MALKNTTRGERDPLPMAARVMDPTKLRSRTTIRTLPPGLAVAPERVLVFRTSVISADQVDAVRPVLDLTVGDGQWNFDLEDHDRILRVESVSMVRERIIALLTGFGFVCAELD